MGFTLGDLAERIGAKLEGDPARPIAGIRTLEEAGPEHLSFLTSPNYLELARRSAAGAILCVRGAALPGRDRLIADHPQLALARALELFHPRQSPAPGIHSTAVIGEGCRIGAGVSIGPYVVLGSAVELGEGAVLHAHVVVGDGCLLGARVELHPHVVLYAGVALGERTVVHAGTVLGADGFGYATVHGTHHKIPQVGGVTIGADVEIGALSAVDRALLGQTVIGTGTKIDNLVQVGHNVQVGERSLLCGQVGIAGSAKIGSGVVLGGRAGVADHLELGDGARVAAASVALESVPAGSSVAGSPAMPLSAWRRQQAIARRLPELWNRLRRIERGLGRGAGEQDGSDGGNESGSGGKD